MTNRRRQVKGIVRGMAMSSVTLVAVAGLGPVSARATTSTVVVPNANTTVQGSAPNAFPFSCGAASFPSMRYQQVYAGGQVGAGSISQIAFRGGTFASTVIPNVTITLSTTSKAVTGLDNVFSNNLGSDVTMVFSGNLTLSGSVGSTYPGPFDIVIPLQVPFAFNPTAGNLLLDVTIPTCVTTSSFDADFKVASSAVMARNFAASSTTTSGGGDSTIFGGLVTQFTLGGTTVPAPVCSVRSGYSYACPTPGGGGPPTSR